MNTSLISHKESNSVPIDLLTQARPLWYAVCTMPRHEKSVARHLGMRFIEHFLPCYSVRQRWKNGLTANIEYPLFPGYVFVRIDTRERSAVLGIGGVYSILSGVGKRPAPLPDAEMEALRTGLHLRRPEPHPLLCIGQRVRILSGALAGLEGVVVRTKNNLRLVLTLDQIRQAVSVEVAANELESVGECAESA